MKKVYVTMIIMLITLSVQVQTWVEQLKNLNSELIDSIVAFTPYGTSNAYGLHPYYIYYHQPLQHDMAASDTFQLRALLLMRDENLDAPSSMMSVFFSGYEIPSDLWNSPAMMGYYYMLMGGDISEVCNRYNGNIILLEHRYFSASVPQSPWTTIGNCRASEAAADFHAIIQAMKRVFTGKFVISGISKGGITTTMQHAFYPDDADFYVPYSAPFCDGQSDSRMQQYWMSDKTWTPELHASMLHLQHEIFNRPSVYAYFKKQYDSSADSDYVRCKFLYITSIFDIGSHTGRTRQSIADIFSQNQHMIDSLGYHDYSDDMLFYLMTTSNTIALDDAYLKWRKDYLAGTQKVNKRLEKRLLRPDVFGITEDDWNQDSEISYFYQAGVELGYFDVPDFSYFFDKKVDADSAAVEWKKYHNVYYLENSMFRQVSYDGTLRENVLRQTKNATKPIFFIYGGDDTWTGAAMDDDCINGSNVRKYIIEAQNHHSASITNADATTRDEIYSYMDKVLGTPASIRGVNVPSETIPSQPRIYNIQGQRVYDMRKGQLYIVNGKKVIFTP